MERAPNLWLPGPLATEGKGAPRPGESAHKPLAAPAARRGGKRRAAPGERPPEPLAAWAARRRGEKARHTRGEGAKTAGCLARARRVLPTHSDICLQRPALPAAGLN